jgi:hypothetical protein
MCQVFRLRGNDTKSNVASPAALAGFKLLRPYSEYGGGKVWIDLRQLCRDDLAQ